MRHLGVTTSPVLSPTCLLRAISPRLARIPVFVSHVTFLSTITLLFIITCRRDSPSSLSQTVLFKPPFVLPISRATSPSFHYHTSLLHHLPTWFPPSSLSRTLTHYAYLLIFLSPISCTILRPVVAGLSQAFLVFNLS